MACIVVWIPADASQIGGLSLQNLALGSLGVAPVKARAFRIRVDFERSLKGHFCRPEPLCLELGATQRFLQLSRIGKHLDPHREHGKGCLWELVDQQDAAQREILIRIRSQRPGKTLQLGTDRRLIVEAGKQACRTPGADQPGELAGGRVVLIQTEVVESQVQPNAGPGGVQLQGA